MATKFEEGIGTVDGVNVTFYTSVPYQAGTLSYFLNGQLKGKDDDDGWFETDPTTGRVDLKEAPLPGDVHEPADDVVQFFYTPFGDVVERLVDQISFLVGRVREVQTVSGGIREVHRLQANLVEIDPIKGRLVVLDEVV